MDFENKVFEGIHYSRIIASWNKIVWRHKEIVEKYNERMEFVNWLSTLTINDKKLPDDVIRDIINLKYNGKLELEIIATNFITDMKKDLQYSDPEQGQKLLFYFFATKTCSLMLKYIPKEETEMANNTSNTMKKVDEAYSECMVEVADRMETLAGSIFPLLINDMMDLDPDDFDKCFLIMSKTMETACLLRANAKKKIA